jgi:hypothetical protein
MISSLLSDVYMKHMKSKIPSQSTRVYISFPVRKDVESNPEFGLRERNLPYYGLVRHVTEHGTHALELVGGDWGA